jgi:hypothetical protein
MIAGLWVALCFLSRPNRFLPRFCCGESELVTVELSVAIVSQVSGPRAETHFSDYKQNCAPKPLIVCSRFQVQSLRVKLK